MTDEEEAGVRMPLAAWWHRRGQVARFELSVRISFYFNIALCPLLLAGLVGADAGPVAASVVAGLTSVHTAVCLLLVRAGLGHYLGARPRPVGLIATGAALTAAGVAAAFVAYPRPTPGHPDGLAAAVLLVLAGAYLAALSTAVRPRVALAVLAGCAVLAGGLSELTGSGGGGLGAAIAVGGLLGAVLVTYRVTLWTLGVVRELERARHVEAGLAVAEERLRFARDLHDVFGRTLSVVAVKSELAAQLAKRGRAEAVDEMLEVRRVAQDSLAELRAVVGGYRAADLDVELAGARALLASAGIACRVDGDGSGLPAALQGALGWVVREGTTNMLRHSEARDCTVTLRTLPDAVSLTIDNDGVAGAGEERVRYGGGLIGLTERIGDLGGTVGAQRHAPDRFRLTVRLPLPETKADR